MKGTRENKTEVVLIKKKSKKKEAAMLPVDQITEMLIALLAGQDVKAVTPSEKATKASLLKDIAYAKRKGFQISIPTDI